MTNTTWRGIVLASLGLLAAGFAQAQAQAGRPALDAAQMAQADTMYQRYCALCHAPDRSGHANDHAPSLRSKSLLESGFPLTLRDAIAYGRPGTPMGGYLDEVGGPLTRDDLRLLTLWLAQVAEAQPTAMSHDPVPGDVALGAKVYAANCATCHGAQGEGITGTALGNPAMLALTPDGFLRHAIVHGRADTPMPAFKDTLAPAEIDGVTAFLRSRSAGWSAPTMALQAPPALDAYILNPKAAAPEFEIKDDLYVTSAVLDRELKAGKRMVLLDTRVTSMWQMAHIAGAVPVPYYSSREQVMANLPRDGTWIVAYCECPRAAAESVVRRLREAGLENTLVLWEGIQGWVSLGYPVVAGRAEGDAHGAHAH